MTIQNKRKLLSLAETVFVMGSLFIIVVGGSFLYWYHYMDGITVNKVYAFRDGVDPMNLQTVKQTYHRGEVVLFETSFCKTRDARTTMSWTLANERLVFFAPSEPRQLPVGCYPDGSGLRESEIHPIPRDAAYGDHYFVGLATITLPDGRERTQSYKTEKFQVVP